MLAVWYITLIWVPKEQMNYSLYKNNTFGSHKHFQNPSLHFSCLSPHFKFINYCDSNEFNLLQSTPAYLLQIAPQILYYRILFLQIPSKLSSEAYLSFLPYSTHDFPISIPFYPIVHSAQFDFKITLKQTIFWRTISNLAFSRLFHNLIFTIPDFLIVHTWISRITTNILIPEMKVISFFLSFLFCFSFWSFDSFYCISIYSFVFSFSILLQIQTWYAFSFSIIIYTILNVLCFSFLSCFWLF